MSQPDATLSPALSALLASTPIPDGAVIQTATVEYADRGVALEGYLAVDASTDRRRPGVLVMHDWLGVGDYVKVRAQMLARLGYVALAADIFGATVRPGPQNAPAVAGGFYGNPALTRARATAGLAQLRAHPLVDPDRIAVIGYCFGGFVALELARTGAELAGAVTFHGALSTATPQDAADIRAKILVLAGGSDPVVPDEQIVELKTALRAAPRVDWQLVSYSGALHSFSQPEVNAPEYGAAYQATADRRSWAAMRAFFDEIFS